MCKYRKKETEVHVKLEKNIVCLNYPLFFYHNLRGQEDILLLCNLSFKKIFSMSHKAGYVNIIGKPNVGKSTLMNEFVGEKISIVTSKAQTTRHRILGIVNGDEFQIVFSDTPGIIKNPAYKMHEVMNQFVNVAFIDADLILYVVDISDKKIDEKTVERLQKTDIPIFVLLNKIDLSDQDGVVSAVNFWQNTLPKSTVFPISALHHANISHIFDCILENFPIALLIFQKTNSQTDQ